MYLHKLVCAIITLRRVFEIVYVQNLISSPVFKQLIHLIFFFIIHCLFIKCIFIVKNCMIRLSLQLQSIKSFHDAILTSALRSYIYLNLTVSDFPSDKYTFDCKNVSFCIELNTFIRLRSANVFLFLIFPCCYFYVMSQSIFLISLGPAPL